MTHCSSRLKYPLWSGQYANTCSVLIQSQSTPCPLLQSFSETYTKLIFKWAYNATEPLKVYCNNYFKYLCSVLSGVQYHEYGSLSCCCTGLNHCSWDEDWLWLELQPWNFTDVTEALALLVTTLGCDGFVFNASETEYKQWGLSSVLKPLYPWTPVVWR